MDLLLIVNESPWGSELPAVALRLANAVVGAGDRILAVFFRADGVYNAISGGHQDRGTPDLTTDWRSFSKQHDVELMLCSAAMQRRLPVDAIADGFRPAGLIEVFDLIDGCDRVVTF